jgi:oxalate decarboxylase/phosphoglucose isomerase-like protein (cupin superfamily)
MKQMKTGKFHGQFDLLVATRGAQAAMMTLPSGGTSDDQPSNEHPRSEQWLFELAGSGRATIGKRKDALSRVALRKGDLLVIERRELHQIKNTGRKPLVTFNLYVPPAYDPHGEPK